ncbi:unnamed protein product [Calypogeia fissa]
MSKRMSLLLVTLLLPLSAFWTITAAPPNAAQDTAGKIELYPKGHSVGIGTVETGITMLVEVLAGISTGEAITVRNGRTRLHVHHDVKFFVDSLAIQDVPVQKDWLKKAMEGVLAQWKSTKKTAKTCPGGHMSFDNTDTLAAGFFKVGFIEPEEKFGLEYVSTDSESIVLTEQQWQGTTLSKETAEAMVFYKFPVIIRANSKPNQVYIHLVEPEIPKLYPQLLPNSQIPMRRGLTLIHGTREVNFFLDSGVDTHHAPITKHWVVQGMRDLLQGCEIIRPKVSTACGGGHKTVAGNQEIVVGFSNPSVVYREHPLETEAGEQSRAPSKRKEPGSSTPEDPKGKRRRRSP